MITQWLFNKARKRVAEQEPEEWATSVGLNLDALLQSIAAQAEPVITPALETRTSIMAYGFMVGFEAGRLACDPVTHVEMESR